MPAVVWLIHGSVDWFWEIPALSGAALGFLAMAMGLGAPERSIVWRRERPRRVAQAFVVAAAAIAGLAAVVVLWFPYLSVREVSAASNIAARNPSGALSDLATAADLDPLSADPGRLGGVIALQNGDFAESARRFAQAISREPGGWFAWLGAGLAATQLGDRVRARSDFAVAERIDSRQPVTAAALARIDTVHPLTPAQAFRLLIVRK
jgi:Flp pilus assembly protein TadD